MQIIDRVAIILFQAKYVICVVEIVEIASFHLFSPTFRFPGFQKRLLTVTSDENYHVIMICLQKMSLHH